MLEKRKIPNKVTYAPSFAVVLLILSALIALFFTLYQLSQPQNLQKRAQYAVSPPLKIKVSNVYPNGFTVSWITSRQTNGAVVHTDNQEKIDDSSSVKVYDERGEKKLSFFHNVKLINLSPGKKYYFKIISGETSFYKSLSDEWQTSGIPENTILPNFSFSTTSSVSESNSPGSYSNESAAFADCSQLPEAKTTPCFKPNLIFGQVTGEDNSGQQALVFLEIPGKSNLISTLSDENGKWSFNLANLTKSDLSGRLKYQPGTDLIKISALGIKGAENTLYRTIPRVGKLSDQTNPVSLSLPTMPEFTPTPIQPTTQPTTAAITPTPTPVAKISLTIKLEKFISKGPSKNVTVSLRKNNKEVMWRKIMFSPQTNGDYKGTLFLNNLGSYSIFIKPDNYLRKDFGLANLTKGENFLNFDQDELLAGDLNNDNIINSLDLSLLLNEINNEGKKQKIGDFNNDGKVDSLDLSILISNYRKQGD